MLIWKRYKGPRNPTATRYCCCSWVGGSGDYAFLPHTKCPEKTALGHKLARFYDPCLCHGLRNDVHKKK